jgi:hypothetical protein
LSARALPRSLPNGFSTTMRCQLRRVRSTLHHCLPSVTSPAPSMCAMIGSYSSGATLR